MGIVLRKVWTSDCIRIIRAVYTEDPEFVRNEKKTLDEVIENTMGLIYSNPDFYRVETQSGALVGFIGKTMKGQNVSHIRPMFRDNKEYLQAFLDLNK